VDDVGPSHCDSHERSRDPAHADHQAPHPAAVDVGEGEAYVHLCAVDVHQLTDDAADTAAGIGPCPTVSTLSRRIVTGSHIASYRPLSW